MKVGKIEGGVVKIRNGYERYLEGNINEKGKSIGYFVRELGVIRVKC